VVVLREFGGQTERREALRAVGLEETAAAVGVDLGFEQQHRAAERPVDNLQPATSGPIPTADRLSGASPGGLPLAKDRMIEFKNVSKRFGARVAVDRLSLTVNPGEVVGFLGPNGAGKSTSLKMLVGLLPIDSGSISVCGLNNVTDSIAVRQLIGYIPDRPFVYDKLTALEFLHFVGELYHMDEGDRRQRSPDMLRLFGLADRGDELIASFSHGMKQRLVMAAALLHRPKVLVVDEPMVGLDPQGAKLVKAVFRAAAHQHGMTVFLSTHSLDTAEEVCDRVGIILDGQLTAFGAVGELRDRVAGDHDLESIFLRITGAGDQSAAAEAVLGLI
jgi:ABC-2 type transport system ATP-binding protein